MAKVKGAATKLQYHNGSAFVDVPNRVQIVPPAMENPPDDRTNLDSTWREKAATIPDGGDVSLLIQWDPADTVHQALLTRFAAGTDTQWKLIFQDTGAAEGAFNGHISGWQWGEVTVENHIRATITIAVNGSVVVTP